MRKTMSNIEALEMIYTNYNVQMILPWSKLYKSNLFKGVKYPDGKIYEDEYTTHKLLYKARSVSYTNEQLYYYLQRKNSITEYNQFQMKKLLSLPAFKERSNFFKKKKLKKLYDKSIYSSLNAIALFYNKVPSKEKKILIKLKDEFENIYKKNINTIQLSKSKKIILSLLNNNLRFYKIINIIKKIRNCR